jgi:hypothetical protein
MFGDLFHYPSLTDSGETTNLIFPIPTEAILPPPHRSREETSSTSSSSRKRKREGDNASETSHVPSLTRVSSASVKSVLNLRTAKPSTIFISTVPGVQCPEPVTQLRRLLTKGPYHNESVIPQGLEVIICVSQHLARKSNKR